jgi:putative membrane protein
MDINPPHKKHTEADHTPHTLPEKLAKGLFEGIQYINPLHYKKFFELSHQEAEDFYKNFFAHQFILRDHLAIDRTMLANESTFLAYIRTALAITAAGGTLIHFSTSEFTEYLGLALIIAGIIGFVIGSTRYRRMKKTITAIRKSKEHEDATKNRKAMTGV